ncbi:MAG: GIY-YIG nuclease family protein [Planctomycetes bacterium]|nr:GIY-YIG nuclease family protein [Planctomycetota bacterium]
MHYVYILLQSNRQLYTGYTADLKGRINQHTNGQVKSTRHKGPLELVHYEAYSKESDARRRERFLKTTEGKRLLRMQIRDLLNEIRREGCTEQIMGSPCHTTGRPVE